MVMPCGSIVKGCRRIFNNEMATKAFSASRMFSGEDKTKAVKLKRETKKGETNQLQAETASNLAAL